MKKCIMGMLAATALSAGSAIRHEAVAQQAAARWIVIDSTTDYVLSVDRSSVRAVAGAQREVWFRRLFSKTQSETNADGAKVQFVREAWLYRLDCAGRRISHRQRILYASTGSPVRTVDFNDPMFAGDHVADMKLVAPETGAERILTGGCALKLLE